LKPKNVPCSDPDSDETHMEKKTQPSGQSSNVKPAIDI
jgi:hypothetical protein